jgi:hypothetical protein
MPPVTLIFPVISKAWVGAAVPIPTLLLEKSYTKPVPFTANPPAIVLVAFVEVALNEPNVGVEVATIWPDAFVDKSEFTAAPESVSGPPRLRVPMYAVVADA